MSDIAEKCRNFAELVRCWNAFELGMQPPARLDYAVLAATLDAAADEITCLDQALSSAANELKAAQQTIGAIGRHNPAVSDSHG